MSSLLWNLPLVAVARDLPRVWGRFDHQRPSSSDYVPLVLAMMALAIGAVVVWYRETRRKNLHFLSDNPARLFRELCAAHRLGFSSRRLLKRLAAAHGLASPALLFVEPKYFEPSSLPAYLRPAAAELLRLRHRLFASSGHEAGLPQ